MGGGEGDERKEWFRAVMLRVIFKLLNGSIRDFMAGVIRFTRVGILGLGHRRKWFIIEGVVVRIEMPIVILQAV